MYTFVTRLCLEIPGKRVEEVLEALLQRYQDHYLPHLAPELASGSALQQLVELLQLCGYDASYHQDRDVLDITDCDVEQLDSARDPVLGVLEGVTPPGSFVELYGDDNSQWRIHYDATRKWVVAGQVLFPQESDALLEQNTQPGELLPTTPLHRDYLLAYVREQNNLTLSLLADLDECLQKMKHEIHSQYSMRAYHPALPREWHNVIAAYQKAAAQMDSWLRLATSVSQETYLSLAEEALQEARARNRGLKVGDTVVLLSSWWEDEESGNRTFARGQHMIVTEFWDSDDCSEEDLDEVATVVLARSPGEEGILEVSLTAIVPLAIWEAMEPERLTDLIDQLPFVLETFPVALDEVPETQRPTWPAKRAWRYRLSLGERAIGGYEFGEETPAFSTASILHALLSSVSGTNNEVRHFLGNILYERFQHAICGELPQ